MSYTKGPWHSAPTGEIMREQYCQPFGIAAAINDTNRCTLIAGVFGDVAGGEDAADANARLIAAAPDMYDFIKTLENDDGKIPEWLWKKRAAVLAKAEGV